MHGEEYRRHLYDLGVAVNLGTNAPKKLDGLLKKPVPKAITSDDVAPGPVRIPKKKRK